MCNYSLKASSRRNAKIGDRLELIAFGKWAKGFAREGGKPSVATCLKSGTEIAFDKPPFFDGVLTWVECDNGERIQVTDRAHSCVARLIPAPSPLGGFQVRKEDVLEFADGKMIAVQCLRVGERATVLQLPVKRRRAKPRVKARAKKQLELV